MDARELPPSASPARWTAAASAAGAHLRDVSSARRTPAIALGRRVVAMHDALRANARKASVVMSSSEMPTIRHFGMKPAGSGERAPAAACAGEIAGRAEQHDHLGHFRADPGRYPGHRPLRRARPASLGAGRDSRATGARAGKARAGS